MINFSRISKFPASANHHINKSLFSMGRPGKIFVYYISIVVVFAGLVYIIPADIISLPESAITENSVDTSLFISDGGEYDSLFVEIRDTITIIDSITFQDTLGIKDTLHKVNITYLIFTDKTYAQLYDFFHKAEQAKRMGKSVRVLHMGDSQIEGDRITRYIRESLQKRFGGTGPGLFTIVDPQKLNPSVWLNSYGDWLRYKIFYRNRVLKDKQYGIMGTVAKFKSETNSGFMVRPSPWAEEKAKKYSKVRLFMGEIKDTLFVKGYIGKTEIISDTLEESDGITEISWEFEDNVPKLKLMFKSVSSPPFLGCALDSLAGVCVDNIALRGQSTPWLHKTDNDLFKTMVSYLDVGLIIFQFGTNMIPTITHDFGFYRIKLEQQLKILKKLAPGCPIIVVGTGDAAYLNKGEETTYNHIVALNKAQEAAAFNSGAGFFDLYNAMGGEGSMIKWVNQEPPLAMSDYIHFTRNGGKQVANMILKSLYAVVDRTGRDKDKIEHKKITGTIVGEKIVTKENLKNE